MFKNEINFIYDLNVNKLQILGDRVTIKDIKSSSIHPALIHFVEASIDSSIFSDRKKIESDSIFSYTSDRINNYFSLISEEIKRIQIFNIRDIKPILQKGIVFNINYITQPNRTLTKFVFQGSEVKSVEEIIIALSHAYYYRYLKKIILTYLEKKKILLMRRDEFYSLLNRVDEISKETHLEETLATAVNSMANFLNTDARSGGKLPLGAVRRYLEEKRLEEFKQRIEDKFGTDENTLVLSSEILSVLRSVTPEKEVEIDAALKDEDELVIDDSPDIPKDGESAQTDFHDDEITQKTENENRTEDIYEVEEDEFEIPNNQLLSEDDFSEEKISSLNEENDQSEIPDSKQDIGDDQVKREELKKKPDSVPLLRKLIDVNLLYEALLPEISPFDSFNETLQLKIKNTELFEGLNFLHDHSTVIEEISILPNKHLNKKEAEFSSDSEYLPDDNYGSVDENVSALRKNSNEDAEDNKEILNDEINENDFSPAIDEIVSDAEIEKEYLAENNSIETVEQELINAKDNSEEAENDIKLIEEAEELTEVFSDLAFLDKEDEITEDEENKDTYILSEENQNSLENENISDVKSYNAYSNFADLVAQKDMTKVIEHIFDYDMEDYHYMINQISDSENEDIAISTIDKYCKNNHIDISSPEVNHFKSIISDYFAQAYS